MDIELDIDPGVEIGKTLYKVKDNNDMVCKFVYSDCGSVGSSSLDFDLENESSGRGKKVERHYLMQTSLQTALAITIHDFPEGPATFVAAMSDPKVGVVPSIAITIHNIRKYARILLRGCYLFSFSHLPTVSPILSAEGLCVALPVYFATNSMWRAFGYALASGLSLPLRPYLLGIFWAIPFRTISMQSCLDLLLE